MQCATRCEVDVTWCDMTGCYAIWSKEWTSASQVLNNWKFVGAYVSSILFSCILSSSPLAPLLTCLFRFSVLLVFCLFARLWHEALGTRSWHRALVFSSARTDVDMEDCRPPDRLLWSPCQMHHLWDRGNEGNLIPFVDFVPLVARSCSFKSFEDWASRSNFSTCGFYMAVVSGWTKP